MDETTFQVAKSAGFVLSFALVFAAQSLWPYRRRARLVSANWRPNLPLAAINTLLTALLCGGCLCAAARFAEARGFGLLRVAGPPLAVSLALTFVALDLTLWAWHRANHRLGVLWRFHRVHHSDVDFDVTTSLRFHAGELLLSLPIKMAVALLLGAPVSAILLFEVVFGLFNMLVHGNLRLPAAAEAALAGVLILPAAHRRHHSVEPADRDANFGTVLSIWDRLAGTSRAARSTDAVTTGLPGTARGAAAGTAPAAGTTPDVAPPPGLWRCLVLPFAALPTASGAPGLERRADLR